MPARRALPLLFATPALAEGAPGYRWRVMREGSMVGTHTVTFSRRGAERVAVSDVSVVPTVLGVVVYRYEHRTTEVTRNGSFLAVESRLNRNGRIVELRAQALGDAVLVRGPEGERRLPADAAPLSWWEPQRMGGAVPLFGTTHGRASNLRWRREAVPGGGVRWHMTGDLEAMVEYDAAGRWVAHAVRGDDGSLVTYAPA